MPSIGNFVVLYSGIPEYKNKKMHIDGIKEIDIVDGYRISLHENIDGSTLDNSDYSYDEVKKM